MRTWLMGAASSCLLIWGCFTKVKCCQSLSKGLGIFCWCIGLLMFLLEKWMVLAAIASRLFGEWWRDVNESYIASYYKKTSHLKLQKCLGLNLKTDSIDENKFYLKQHFLASMSDQYRFYSTCEMRPKKAKIDNHWNSSETLRINLD